MATGRGVVSFPLGKNLILDAESLVMMSTQPCTAEKLMTTTSMHTYTIPYCEDFRYKNMPMIFGCFCLSGMLFPRSAYHRNARALRLYAVCRLSILGTRTHAYIVYVH